MTTPGPADTSVMAARLAAATAEQEEPVVSPPTGGVASQPVRPFDLAAFRSGSNRADMVPWRGTQFTAEQIALLPSPVDLVGQAAATAEWYTAPLPTLGERTFREIASTMNWIDAENPVLVNDLLRYGWSLMALPEMIAGVRSQAGWDNGEAIAMLEALVPDLPDFAAEKVEQALEDSPLVSEFFQETGHMWKAEERETMMMILATLPARDDFGFRRRDAVLSLAMQYIADGDHDLNKTDQRARFFQNFYLWARQQQQESWMTEGGVARGGEVLAAPFRFASRKANEIIGNVVSDPEEWKWRQALSLGQNFAVTVGLEPGDGLAWQLSSGSFDVLANLSFLDPINWLAGFGVGIKAARTIPAVGRLGKLPRVLRGLTAAVPIVGRHTTNLPRFSRGLTARLAYGLFSHSEDEFAALALKNGVFGQMHRLLQSSGPSGLIEAYPQLRPVADTFVKQVLAYCRNPEEIAEAWRIAARGGFTTGAEGEGVEFLRRLASHSGHTYHSRVSAGLEAGAVAPHTLRGDDGFRPQAFVVGRHIDTGNAAQGTHAVGFERYGEPVLGPDGAPIGVLRPFDEVGDLEGSVIWRATNPDGSLLDEGAGVLDRPGFGPPRPSSYDDSPVVVLPEDWNASAVLGEGVVKGVAEGAGEQGMARLMRWLETHPEFSAVAEASTAVENASHLHVLQGKQMVPLHDAIVNAVPEGLAPEAASAWHMRQQGITITAIAEHFGVSRSTISSRIQRAETAFANPTGIHAVRTGSTLTDTGKVRKIGGVQFHQYVTADGVTVWARGNQGVTRVATSYDSMSPVSRLYYLLQDLAAGTVEAAPVTGAKLSQVVARNSEILARTLADPDVVRVLLRFGQSIAPDLDEVRLITRLLPGMEDTFDIRILTSRGGKRVQRAKMTTQPRGPVDLYAGEYEAMMQRNLFAKQIELGGSRTLWIKDFPTHMPTVLSKTGKMWRAHASNDGKGWWAFQRRLVSAGFFNPKYKPIINLHDGGDGAHSLGVFLRKIGARRSFVDEWTNRFLNAAPADRYAVVRDCINAVTEQPFLNHPLFRFNLTKYIEKQGIRTYASMGEVDKPGFTELGLARSRSGGEIVAVPFIPSHMTIWAVLPGDDFFKSLRRWRRTQHRFRLMPGYDRGLAGTGATRTRRMKLVESYRDHLKAQGIDPATLGRGNADENLLAMAYATAYRTKDDRGGLGKIAHASRVLGKTYNVGNTIFAISQLALRFPAWSLRVLIEEQMRSTFFDLPSMARNPFRMMAGYFDEYLIARVATFQKKNQTLMRGILTDMWAGLPASSTVEGAIEHARTFLPGVDSLIAGKTLADVDAVKAAIGKALTTEFLTHTNADILGGSRYLTRTVVRRTKRAQFGRERMVAMGLSPDFDWGDVGEIRNKGFMRMLMDNFTASGSLPVMWAKNQMTIEQTEKYGVSLGRSLHQLINDPIMGKFALNRAVARLQHGTASGWDATDLVHSPYWYDIRGNVRRMAEYQLEQARQALPPMPARGLPAKEARAAAAARTAGNARVTELEMALASTGGDSPLAAWFLTNVVDRYADYMFGWLYKGKDDSEAARILSALANKEGSPVTLGSKTYILNPGQHHEQAFTHAVRDMVAEQGQHPDVRFPTTVTSHWDARYMFEDSPDTLTGGIMRGARWLMAFAGDSASQVVNRRPAFLAQYRDSYRYFKARGFSEEAAQQAARFQAIETVNYVFYNMENAVPFLRQVSKISPFFTAWWEVAQTWAYKIPALYGWPVGTVVLGRKVSRVLDALVTTGLLQVDAEADPGSPIGTRQMRLRLDPRSQTGNAFGDVMSKGLYYMLATPVNVAMHLASIANIVQDPERDVITLSVGSPIDPWSHGLMGVNQAYLGLNPLAGLAASNTVAKIPYATGFKTATVATGETAATIAARLNTTASGLYTLNRRAIIDALGEDRAKQLFDGLIPPDSPLAVLPEGMVLKIPGTSLLENLIDPTFFPFGREDTLFGSFWDLSPSWLQYVLRGIGLWIGSTDSYDEPGGSPTDSGFLSVVTTPETAAGIDGEVLLQIMHLEAAEGLMTGVVDAQARLNSVKEAYGPLINVEEIEGGGYTWTNEFPNDTQLQVYANLFQSAYEEARLLEEELLARAMNQAGSAQVLRGILGFMSPGIPQMLYHEQELVAAYHNARALAQMSPDDFTMENLPLPMLNGDDPDAARQVSLFNNMVATWLQDPDRGSFARNYLLRNHANILPFTMGKTFWKASGEPPEVVSMDRYSLDMRAGLRAPYTPSVFMQRYARTSNAFDRETSIVQKYGADPVVAASRIVQDYAAYRAFMDAYRVKDAALDYADDLFNDGDYLHWTERNRGDNATLVSELQREAYLDISTLEEWAVNADEVMAMSPEQRREFVGDMKGIVSALRQGIQGWEDAMGSTGIENPRQQVLATYFDEHVGAYYEHLATLYDSLDTITDSETRSRVYDEIRTYQNTKGMETVYIEGVRFPSVLDWWWRAKTSEEQQDQLLRWVASKPEWVSVFAAQRLAEKNPEAARYLPDTLEEAQTYDAYNAARNTLGDMFEPGIEDFTLSAYGMGDQNKMSAALEQAFVDTLTRQGRLGEVEWREMMPVQRLYVLGLLPETLKPYVPYVNTVLETCAANEVSPGSQMGKDLFTLIFVQIMRDMEANPRIGDDLISLGQRMFDVQDYDNIFPRLFQGAFIGEI